MNDGDASGAQCILKAEMRCKKRSKSLRFWFSGLGCFRAVMQRWCFGCKALVAWLRVVHSTRQVSSFMQDTSMALF